MSLPAADAVSSPSSLVARMRSLWPRWPWLNRRERLPTDAPDPDEEFELSLAPPRPERRSYEWIPFGDKDPLCWAPWRVLKVDIFGRTQNCCGFFEKLPEFDWPSARDFHKETGMWNHPLVQQLRTTMGTADELPFCTFCKEDDKRHPDAAAAKRQSSIQSGAVFQQIYDRTAPFTFRGDIDKLPEDLATWSAPSRTYPGTTLRPFRNNKLFYRRLVRTRGFWNLGHVLIMGVLAGSMAPFLAEANEQLTLADLSKGRLRKNADLLQALGLGDPEMALIADPRSHLPWEAEVFDGVWLDGSWLYRFGRLDVLKELRRVTRRGAPVYVSGAPGLGFLVQQAIAAPTQDEAGPIIEAIGKGPTFKGIGGFMSAETLVAALRGSGFGLDRRRPALSLYHDGIKSGSEDWSSHWLVAERLSDESHRLALRAAPDRLRGLVDRVSFTARAE